MSYISRLSFIPVLAVSADTTTEFVCKADLLRGMLMLA